MVGWMYKLTTMMWPALHVIVVNTPPKDKKGWHGSPYKEGNVEENNIGCEREVVETFHIGRQTNSKLVAFPGT